MADSQYATTFAAIHGMDENSREDFWPREDLKPESPDGGSWKLVSSAANDRFIFWTWERNVSSSEGRGS